MRKKYNPYLFAVLGFALLGASAISSPAQTPRTLQIKDALGSVVKVPEHPRRVVTLAPSLGELVADLASDQSVIVGVSEYTDYPPSLKKVSSIGPYTRFNLERVMALKPDLILATTDGNARDQVLHLRELGLPVVVVESGSFSQIAQSIRMVGLALGESARGEAAALQLERGLLAIRERGRARAHRKVLLQLGDQPLIVAGRQTFLHEAIEAIGAVNTFGDLATGYPRPAIEEVIRRAPDSIVVFAMGMSRDVFEKMALAWRAHPSIPAVKNGDVKILDADSLGRPTLRLLEGLSQFERLVYPPVKAAHL